MCLALSLCRYIKNRGDTWLSNILTFDVLRVKWKSYFDVFDHYFQKPFDRGTIIALLLFKHGQVMSPMVMIFFESGLWLLL